MKTLIVSALIAAVQLPAGTGDGVACVMDRTSPADRLAIAEGALGPERPPGPPSEAENRLGDHLIACADQHGWDEPQILRVSSLAIAGFVRTVAQERLVGAGIDVAALDRWFDRQSDEFRTTAFHSMPEDRVDAALLTLEGDVMPAELLDAHAEIVGGYLAMRIIFIRVAAGLPIE